MEPTLRDQIAAEVRAELARKAMKPKQAAEMLGIHRSAASLKLRGKRQWRADELIKLAHWLDVPVTRFLPEPSEVAS